METSISSLSFKGSVVEAIAEAKRQKKLFVVYISGDNPESNQLETSTWEDKKVVDALLKYCILLHIPEGSIDAVNFSAIYPQKPAPCITVVGHNGMQLWQRDGIVSTEVLASGLEKAWLSIHIQETTAGLLTAALASKKSEQFAIGSSDSTSFARGSSSRIKVPSTSTENSGQFSRDERTITKKSEANEDCKHTLEDRDPDLVDDVCLGLNSDCTFESGKVGQSGSLTVKANRSVDTAEISNSDLCDTSSNAENGFLAPEGTTNVINHNSGVMASDTASDGNTDTTEVEKAVRADMSNRELTDVLLNIRLPDGSTLQKKFPVTTIFQMVKDYVDETCTSSLRSYDLAIPYPRKTFKDQDLAKSLTELGLFNRQALIIVPHSESAGFYNGATSSRNQTNSTSNVSSSNGGAGGYFALVKRMLSYINPFSYLGGGHSTSNSGQEHENSPKPTQQGDPGRPYNVNLPNQGTGTGRSNDGMGGRQAKPSRFGSNIHTLKHDEDDSRFSDKNAFWNGNSTQYGGGGGDDSK